MPTKRKFDEAILDRLKNFLAPGSPYWAMRIASQIYFNFEYNQYATQNLYLKIKHYCTFSRVMSEQENLFDMLDVEIYACMSEQENLFDMSDVEIYACIKKISDHLAEPFEGPQEALLQRDEKLHLILDVFYSEISSRAE